MMLCSPGDACGAEVKTHTSLVDAESAILSLQLLAPDLTVVKALQLAKAACTPAMQRRDESYKDLTGLLGDRPTDRELAEKIAENIKSENLTEASVVSFDIAGHKKSFSVLVAHANADCSIRTFPHNQPHNGFTYCMACNMFLWPLRPPPALVPPSANLKSKLWNAADTALRCMAAERAAVVRCGGGGSGRHTGGSRVRSSSGGGSTIEKFCFPNDDISHGQFLRPVPVACVNGPEPSADVADHEFFTGLGGWMPVASSSSQVANIRTHLKSQGHTSRMQTLRLLARSGAGHFSWLPELVAGVRLCPFLVPEPERLHVLGGDEAVAASAAAAAIPSATDYGVVAA
ncbi:hypothetical protein Vretimale_3485 [Volvox reticuliferus]|uniref:Uncharacterized protein n=1 Tax=Volvox reticuliferus TaxID=1737510 RepID=A0A8J4D8M8_9CHLO|nr:hypothetical protein Vretimale_3485 [Volvox reticuliferus]